MRAALEPLGRADLLISPARPSHARRFCMFKADAESRAARRYLKLQVVLQSIEGQKKALRFICAQVERAATASSLAKRISLTPFLGTLGTDGSCRSPSVVCAVRRPLPDAPGPAPIPASPSGCGASFSASSRQAHARPPGVSFRCSRKFVLPMPSFLPGQVPARDWSCRS